MVENGKNEEGGGGKEEEKEEEEGDEEPASQLGRKAGKHGASMPVIPEPRRLRQVLLGRTTFKKRHTEKKKRIKTAGKTPFLKVPSRNIFLGICKLLCKIMHREHVRCCFFRFGMDRSVLRVPPVSMEEEQPSLSISCAIITWCFPVCRPWEPWDSPSLSVLSEGSACCLLLWHSGPCRGAVLDMPGTAWHTRR